MAGEDSVKRGTEASATDVFGTVSKEPVKEEPARPAPPALAAPPLAASPVPAANASSGGFTQLLRALNYDAVKEIMAAAPVENTGTVPVAPARAVGGAVVEARTAEKPAVSPSSSQVTSFLPQGAPSLSATHPPSSAAPVGGSFTQLFQRLEAEPVSAIAPEKPAAATAAPSFTQMFATAPEAPMERAEPVTAPPESFTQLFAGLDADRVEATPVAPVVKTVATSPDAAHPVVHRSVAPEDPAAASVGSPGSFTRMFQTLDAPIAEPEREDAPVDAPVDAEIAASPARLAEPVPAPVNAESPPSSSPGSFTRMFQALDPPRAEEVRYAPPLSQVPKPAAASAPGSFTQMFQTLSEEPPRAREPESAPGSFTQMFGNVSPSSQAPVPAPPGSHERPFAASAPEREESGASEMFATHREPQLTPAERGPAFSPLEAAPAGPPTPVGSTPSSGGLTQLLRALDGPTPAPKPYAAPSYPPPVAASPPAGSFTGVYGELGTVAGATSAPVVPPVAPPAAAAGPSEFTRLINASSMREASLRGGGEATGAPVTPAAAPAGGGAGFAPPSGLPAAPKAPFAFPAAPQASVAGPEGAHAGVSAAGGGQASFAVPAMPKVPSAPPVKMPEVPKAAGAPAGIQKYVPLLLILVIFLLLAILVAVVVLMKK